MSAEGLLIFDLDGTLFDTRTAAIPAVRGAFAEHGLSAPAEHEVADLFGESEADFYAWLGERVPPDLVSAVADLVGRRELELVSRTGRLYPNARETLGKLREMVAQMAICSNGPERYVQTVIESHRLAGLFDAVRWRREHDTSKPQMVGDLLGRLTSRPAALIGDRRDDVRAARHNGISAIGASYGYGGPGELDGADAAVCAVEELLEVIPELMRGGLGSAQT